MSFLNKLSNIFGFGSTEYDELEENPQVQEESQAQIEQSAANETAESSETTEGIKVDIIFEQVLAVFNASLPDFLAKSIDPERQRKALFEALSNSSQQYLRALAQAADDKCQAAYMAERQKMMAEAVALKKKADDLEAKRQEIRDRQLSAERQKRALSDRVRDLEEQNSKLESEREQLEIENKCMVNKTKAAAVLETELEELRDKVANGEISTALASDDETKAKFDALLAQKAALENTIEKLNKEKEQLDAKIESITTDKNALEAKVDNMSIEKAVLDGKIERLNADKASLESKNELQTAKINQLEETIAQLSAKIPQSDADFVTPEQLREIQHGIETFEQVKDKLNARIEKLRANLRQAQEENQSLRDSIRTNMIDNAEQIKTLEAEIEKLKMQHRPFVGEEATSEAQVDDALLLGGNWLVSAPPEKSTMRPSDDDSDFGYQPPQRKSRAAYNNDAQLSLFD